ncbi:MAG: hypothetical protein RL757_2334 [Bacteroidota bacterium]|jgi:hypothetical protein
MKRIIKKNYFSEKKSKKMPPPSIKPYFDIKIGVSIFLSFLFFINTFQKSRKFRFFR